MKIILTHLDINVQVAQDEKQDGRLSPKYLDVSGAFRFTTNSFAGTPDKTLPERTKQALKAKFEELLNKIDLEV